MDNREIIRSVMNKKASSDTVLMKAGNIARELKKLSDELNKLKQSAHELYLDEQELQVLTEEPTRQEANRFEAIKLLNGAFEDPYKGLAARLESIADDLVWASENW